MDEIYIKHTLNSLICLSSPHEKTLVRIVYFDTILFQILNIRHIIVKTSIDYELLFDYVQKFLFVLLSGRINVCMISNHKFWFAN